MTMKAWRIRAGFRRLAAVSAVACALGLVAGLPAAAQSPVGGEFQVNTYATSVQRDPAVAMNPDGNFVVTWMSFGSSGSDTSGFSIHGQRYASDGSAEGAEFQVNTYTTNWQQYPSVAMAADGGFVVVWYSVGSSGTDTGISVQAQRYASDGSPAGGEFQVNTYTTNNQTSPSVAMEANGDFVVVWQSQGSGTDPGGYSVQAQRYTSNGSTQGAQFQVNTYTTGAQVWSSVAADDDGDFVVVWTGPSGTDTSDGIRGQRYASNGSTAGGEFQVNTYTTNSQGFPGVAAEANGDFVVVWHSNGSSGTDTSGESIHGQRYASDGSVLDGEFQVNTSTTNSQTQASVAMGPAGEFMVVWSSAGSYGSDSSSRSTQGRRYASDGAPLAGQVQVNTNTPDGQESPSVAGFASGYVVAWEDEGADFDVKAQRYAPTAPSHVPSLSPSAAAAAALLMLLAAGFALRRRV
jgi:hypothetical protein